MKNLFLVALALSVLHGAAAVDPACPSLVITGFMGGDNLSRIYGVAPSVILMDSSATSVPYVLVALITTANVPRSNGFPLMNPV